MADEIYIYRITSPTGRIYIGQTNNVRRRKIQYKSGCKGQTRLHESFRKHGIDNHVFEIIETCCVQISNSRERYWQEHYDVLGAKGLNCRYQKYDGKTGKLSSETRRKISESNKGRQHSKEAIEKASMKKRGKKRPPELIEALRQVHLGKIVSVETRKKMSEARMGFKPSKETIEKYRAANIGKKLSMETRDKLIEVNKKSKKVVDVVSGKTYHSVRQASIDIGVHYETLRNWMNGISPNKSNIRYVF